MSDPKHVESYMETMRVLIRLTRMTSSPTLDEVETFMQSADAEMRDIVGRLLVADRTDLLNRVDRLVESAINGVRPHGSGRSIYASDALEAARDAIERERKRLTDV